MDRRDRNEVRLLLPSRWWSSNPYQETQVKVSIVILNYFHPEVIEICLRTLKQTITPEGLEYEVIVVDNGSDPSTVKELSEFKSIGWIDKLILNPVNRYFAGGNNDGVRAADPDT